MSRYPHLMSRNGHYYFRISVPVLLIPVLGKQELTFSLKTKNPLEAKARCLSLLNITQDIFQGTRPYRSLKSDLARLQAEWRGKCIPISLLAEANTPEPLPIEEGEKIAALHQEYLKECKGNRSKTIAKKQAIFSLWVSSMGDMPAKAIGKAQARAFKQLLTKLPSNMQKRHKGLSISQIDLATIPEDQKLSVRTINYHLAYMGTFFNWMIRNGQYEAVNPFIGMALKEAQSLKDKKQSFSERQLRCIFSSPFYTGCKSEKITNRFLPGSLLVKDAMYWIPLIALYSGARMQEIAQLYVSDLKQIEDIWVFDFNEEGADKQLKTSSSCRKTPIHPKLIELGLLDHAKAQRKGGEQRMFSDLKRSEDGTYSSGFSKRFNYMLGRFKIKTNTTSFHSFRHTFIDALRNTDVQKEVKQALVGHLDARTAHDTYGSGMGVKRLMDGISRLDYPCLRF